MSTSKFSPCIFGLLVFFALIRTASATTPTVASFIPTPSSINSHQVVTFVWNIQNGGGYSFIVPCLQGFKFSKNGTLFPCDIKVSSTETTSDGIILAVSNASGATRPFTARIIPKDATGADYNAGAQDVSVNVVAVPDPILSFTTSATTTVPGALTTLSWSSQDIDGVNMVFECNENIRASSTSYLSGQFISCGTPLPISDLPPSGSMSFKFFNTTKNKIPYTVKLLPAIAPSLYDGIHAQTLTFNVESDVLPDPVTDSFTTSTSMANSGEEIMFSWGTGKSDGANIQIQCNTQLSAQTIINGATSTLPCNTPAFSTPLAATSTASISFINKNFTTEYVTVYLFPLRKEGGYDATRGKQINLIIRAPHIVQVQEIPPVIQQQPPPEVATLPNSIPKYTFTKGLGRGSRGADVTALQKYLAQFPDLYPSGLVTGYLGILSEQAIKLFQVKYGVASSGNPGYGYVGPKTRAKLNSMQ